MARHIWYPLKVRGKYVPFPFGCDDYTDKRFVCETEKQCEELCMKLNEETLHINEKEGKMKKYTVHYSFYLSDSVEIEANSEEDAKTECKKMLLGGDIGNLNEMDIGESEVWVD